MDIFSATTLPGADDDDEHKVPLLGETDPSLRLHVVSKVEGRRKDQEAEQKNEQCRT